MRVLELSTEKMKDYLDKISVLIVTATKVESDELIENLVPFPGEERIIQFFAGNQTYYLGILGIYGVVMVQSEMGAVGRDSALITTLRAIEIWQPKAIIMIGIAFGIDSQSQHIGDVIVSSHIIPYENSRVGKERIFRAELPPASSLLLNRIKQIRDWNFPVSRSAYAKLYVGPILSGEKLIDNKQFRDDLVRAFPNAIGGEMESAGVYAAASEKKKDWVIIKSICDFADGEKNNNKKEYQAIAIKAAVSFAKRMLSIRYGFADLGFEALIETNELEPSSTSETNLRDLVALFDAIEKHGKEKPSDALKVIARQIVQTDADNQYSSDANSLKMLIPSHVLASFENRISKCWAMYNEVLASGNGYLPAEIDNASEALMQCICRELRRLLKVNGEIPEGKLRNYWLKYRCDGFGPQGFTFTLSPSPSSHPAHPHQNYQGTSQ